MGLFVAPASAWGSQMLSRWWGKGDFGGHQQQQGKREFKSQGNAKPSCAAAKKDGGKKRGPFRSLPAGGGCLRGTCLPLLPPFLWLLTQLKAWVNEPLRGEGANGEPKSPAPLMSGQGPAHRNTEHLPLL